MSIHILYCLESSQIYITNNHEDVLELTEDDEFTLYKTLESSDQLRETVHQLVEKHEAEFAGDQIEISGSSEYFDDFPSFQV